MKSRCYFVSFYYKELRGVKWNISRILNNYRALQERRIVFVTVRFMSSRGKRLESSWADVSSYGPRLFLPAESAWTDKRGATKSPVGRCVCRHRKGSDRNASAIRPRILTMRATGCSTSTFLCSRRKLRLGGTISYSQYTLICVSWSVTWEGFCRGVLYSRIQQ